MQKIIFFLFSLLFFFTPLVFFPKSSELFEFNKMVVVYILTALITTGWLIKSIIAKKFIFKRSLLDLPLLLFLISQILATIFSIDRYTSIFGYYSRFNGGLLSTLSYILLYWAYVSNFTTKDATRHIRVLLSSAALVGLWAMLEHFGYSLSCLIVTGNLNVDCWVQDVQFRVFASIGQPNWLAAWIVGLIPLNWAFIISKNKYQVLHHLLNLLFFVTLLFTKSRSGIIAFIAAFVIFWGYSLIKHKRNLLRIFILNSTYLILATLLVGTPWTPSLVQSTEQPSSAKVVGPALETGGTESGRLRRIVWQGALDLWRAYPVFGTGVETFAYTYYAFRPLEHNNTSEWDFLYNKAHNEYLNFAANTGSVGLLTYIFLIITIVLSILNSKNQDPKTKQITNYNFKNSKIFGPWNLDLGIYQLALISGFVSLLITNFFGFSVVLTNLLFFLFPALAITLVDSRQKLVARKKLSLKQKILVFTCLLTTIYLLLSLSRYWYADLLYAKGRRFTDQNEANKAIPHLVEASQILPSHAVYHDQLSVAYSQVALGLYEQNQATDSAKFVQAAVQETNKAYALSPRNVNLLKSRANIYTDLSAISENYLLDTIKTLQLLLLLAPTDASIYQRIGLAIAQAGELDVSVGFFEKAIELKPDYKRARQALAHIYTVQKKYAKAKEQLEYILQKISPEDELIKSQLKDLEKKAQ